MLSIPPNFQQFAEHQIASGNYTSLKEALLADQDLSTRFEKPRS